MSEKFDENKRRILAMNKPDELHSYVPQSSIIVSRNCTLPDVSTTQDVLTSIKTSNSIENTNPDYYKQELASRDEIIARLKEDAERLATRAVYWDDYGNEYECIHLECSGHSENILFDHAPDCPITLHRALMKELE